MIHRSVKYYLLKVTNINTRKLRTNTSGRSHSSRSAAFTVNFQNTSQLFLVFLLLFWACNYFRSYFNYAADYNFQLTDEGKFLSNETDLIDPKRKCESTRKMLLVGYYTNFFNHFGSTGMIIQVFFTTFQYSNREYQKYW